uniref:hypothetical protein n=1 Tax=Klebsiella pneumoniae TaxID=573 RepID=UPI001D0F418A
PQAVFSFTGSRLRAEKEDLKKILRSFFTEHNSLKGDKQIYIKAATRRLFGDKKILIRSPK